MKRGREEGREGGRETTEFMIERGWEEEEQQMLSRAVKWLNSYSSFSCVASWEGGREGGNVGGREPRGCTPAGVSNGEERKVDEAVDTRKG